MLKCYVSFFLCCSMLFLASCSPSTEGTQTKTNAVLSGTVTSKGKPVKDAQINFENPAIGAWGTEIGEDGKYTLEIAAGDFKVSILPTFNVPMDMSASSDGKIPEPPKRDDVPEKYRAAGTSGLEVNVSEGNGNTFDVTIE